MNDIRIENLIQLAHAHMRRSHDPAHSLDHAARVVAHIERFAEDLHLSEDEKNALVLAGWWHDVSRTITERPSIILMLFVDDMLSALMLWRATIHNNVFGTVAGMSTRLIFCKSLGTGRLFTRLFLRKRTRGLLNILKDADTLDMMNVERICRVCKLVESSSIYAWGYRLLAWYNFKTNIFKMKTSMGRRYLQELTREVAAWMMQPEVWRWHLKYFGRVWVRRTFINVTRRLDYIEHLETRSMR